MGFVDLGVLAVLGLGGFKWVCVWWFGLPFGYIWVFWLPLGV